MDLWALAQQAADAFTVGHVYDLIMRIIVPAIVGVLGWGCRLLWQLNDRMTRLENTTQSKEEARNDRHAYYTALNDLRREIAQQLGEEVRELKEEIKGLRSDLQKRPAR